MGRSCAVCGAEDFVCMDGFYYCSVCSMQSMQHEQEVEEHAENLNLTAKSEIRASKAKPEQEAVSDARHTYEEDLKEYTVMLSRQVDALISYGFSPVIKRAAKVLWFRMVLQAIKDGHARDSRRLKHRRKKRSEEDAAVTQEDKTKATVDEHASEENLLLKRQKIEPYVLRPITTLAVCWFACRSCGYKILISDLCLLVTQRLLPFYGDTLCDDIRQSTFGEKNIGNRIVSLSYVYWKFCVISRTFTFLQNVVTMEVEEMIARFSFDLNLPGEVFQTALDLMRRLNVSNVVNLHEDALPKFTSQRLPTPLEMKAMCFIVIALKGLFKLNDSHEQQVALTALRRYKDNDFGHDQLPFLFPCWLLHNELKMAIMEGSSVEEVLSPAWFDCNAKIVNRVMVEFYNISHLRSRDKIRSHVLSGIFQASSHSVAPCGPGPFAFRSLPRRFESLLANRSHELDADTVALFCSNFASMFIPDCPSFPDGPNYGFYPTLPHHRSDNSSHLFKEMSLAVFSTSFDRLLRLCSSYLFCVPKLLFIALQKIELELMVSPTYPKSRIPFYK
uniref:TATA box-binding protein-associated factor RNA polymerase I subunit B n=1 Tax=Trichuris muris TaxID=70415 RepID=A0A5S6QPX7_TRIMR